MRFGFNIDTVVYLEEAVANLALEFNFVLKWVLLVYMLHHALFVNISMTSANAYALRIHDFLLTNSALLPHVVAHC